MRSSLKLSVMGRASGECEGEGELEADREEKVKG